MVKKSAHQKNMIYQMFCPKFLHNIFLKLSNEITDKKGKGRNKFWSRKEDNKKKEDLVNALS